MMFSINIFDLIVGFPFSKGWIQARYDIDGSNDNCVLGRRNTFQFVAKVYWCMILKD